MKKAKSLLLALMLVCGLFLTCPLIGQAASKYYVTTAKLNIYKHPGSNKVVDLPKEAVVKFIKKHNSKWYKVEYQNSKQKKFTGYVSAKKLKKAVQYKVKGNLNIRKNPSSSSSSGKVHVMKKGSKVFVVNTTAHGKWYKVVFYEKGKVYRGYAYKDYLKKVTGSSSSSSSSSSKIYKAKVDVNMHKHASNANKFVVVRKGRKVKLLKKKGNWYKCSYKAPSGTTYTGYIYKTFLKKV